MNITEKLYFFVSAKISKNLLCIFIIVIFKMYPLNLALLPIRSKGPILTKMFNNHTCTELLYFGFCSTNYFAAQFLIGILPIYRSFTSYNVL